MDIYERIKLITTAFKHLNGYIPEYFAPMSSDLLGVKVCLNGVYVDAVGVAFNDLMNRNLSLTINHPMLNSYRVCLKLHISKDGESYIWVEAMETDYLMPFVGLRAMMLDWRFIEDEEDLEDRQAALEEKWYETYYPVVVTP